ncbi:Ig-like domain-containing protein [Stappia sp.]|uniref:Ig-like domain-containing protein n=1 Tax=Stappia sp. TaxID=1870903 RepID=UPI0025F89869|nr:Ig-like domain-containing protein [Stappia sp.]
MSRKLVIQLLVLAIVVGLGALGIGIWQERQNARQAASSPTQESGDAGAPRETARSDDKQPESTPDASAPADQPDTSASDTASSSDESTQPSSSDTKDSAQASSGPSFDLMRVEPDGSAVVAGRAEAGSIVALLSNGKVVGKGIANANGEFAIVLDTPLEAGAHAVTLETQDKDGKALGESEQSLAVSVPEDPDTGEVLVMLNEPGAPSRVLQKPDALEGQDDAPAGEAGTGDTQMAAADTDAAPSTSRSPETGETGASSGDTASNIPAADNRQQASDPTTDGSDRTNVEDNGAVASASTPQDEGKTTSGDTGAPVGQATADAGDQADGEPSGDARVTVDAVETENDKVFVAGAGEPGSDVRVYLDNKLVGEAKTDEKGRWLLEGESKVEPGQVDVRADQVRPNDGSVEARAQVTFEKAAPEAVVLRPLDASGSSDAGSGAQGSGETRQVPSVIIRTGDNLWTISQRRYGQGVRYTTIYQANKDQIRNPDLIYPGQIFMLPESDRNWSSGD